MGGSQGPAAGGHRALEVTDPGSQGSELGAGHRSGHSQTAIGEGGLCRPPRCRPPVPPGLRLSFWLLLGLCRCVPDAPWSSVLLGWPFPNLHPEQLLGGERFPSQLTPHPQCWSCAHPYALGSEETSPLLWSQLLLKTPPARPQPHQSLQLGPQEAWGLGRCWWILGTQQAPLVREQFPALSFTRSATMGMDEPSRDPTLSSVTCV